MITEIQNLHQKGKAYSKYECLFDLIISASSSRFSGVKTTSRKLAERWNVSHTSVQKILKEFQNNGLICIGKIGKEKDSVIFSVLTLNFPKDKAETFPMKNTKKRTTETTTEIPNSFPVTPPISIGGNKENDGFKIPTSFPTEKPQKRTPDFDNNFPTKNAPGFPDSVKTPVPNVGFNQNMETITETAQSYQHLDDGLLPPENEELKICQSELCDGMGIRNPRTLFGENSNSGTQKSNEFSCNCNQSGKAPATPAGGEFPPSSDNGLKSRPSAYGSAWLAQLDLFSQSISQTLKKRESEKRKGGGFWGGMINISENRGTGIITEIQNHTECVTEHTTNTNSVTIYTNSDTNRGAGAHTHARGEEQKKGNSAFAEELKRTSTFVESVAMQLRRGVQDVKNLIDEFACEQEITATAHESLEDYRRHFYHWAKKNVENANRKLTTMSKAECNAIVFQRLGEEIKRSSDKRKEELARRMQGHG